jgi:hypothetical protein
MDKEIELINSILIESPKPLTTSEISKLIYEKHKVKISRTIVKNYLWSYFRQIVRYSPADYTYELDSDKFLLDDIYISIENNSVRPIHTVVEGNKINVKISQKLTLKELVRAFAILNFRIGPNKGNTDILKQLNRIIEQFND